LEKRIDALVTPVEFGGHGDDEHIEVEGIEVERGSERGEARAFPPG
jgi:hypothetical protein